MFAIGTHSGYLQKALAANSVANTFQTLQPTRGVPTLDGMGFGSATGVLCPKSLLIVPFGEGSPGAIFSLRVYGMHNMKAPQLGDVLAEVWIHLFLAEMVCTLSNVGGVKQGSDALSGVDLIQTELLCDTITLTQGDLGRTGRINSTGPGSNLVAYALVDLQGCRRFVVDFQQIDANTSMNCLTLVL